jgi:phosphoglycerate dehydrogenase-like enzyme
MAKIRCAILDDYQNVAFKMADWSAVANDLDITVFDRHLGDTASASKALQGFPIICSMRERTPFGKDMFEKLPDLKLLTTTGMVNRGIDLDAAKAHNVMVCGTASYGNPTAGITFGLILELTRRIGYENARLKAGESWQVTIGPDLEGLTLGVIGLGKLGTRVSRIGQAFGMKTLAWSQNLTPERAKENNVGFPGSKEELLKQSDIVSIHVPLSPRSRGMIGAKELALLKPTALLINTSRGPIVDQEPLLEVLQNKKIAGAGLDVYEVEPLPVGHPLRKLDNVVLTPHLGYVSEQNYRIYFPHAVEDIRGYLDGKPVRVLTV